MLFHSSLQAKGQSSAAYRNFWQPYYHGERLNYCSFDGKICGLKLAHFYCQKMGYERADQEIIAHNVGLTRFLNLPNQCPQNKLCRGWQCNGFKTIRCTGSIRHTPPKYYHYSKRHFVLPRYNFYRVAYCYDGEKGCGLRAAYSFCRRLGYMRAIGYKKAEQVAATQAIGNQKLCFGSLCTAFEEINCAR